MMKARTPILMMAVAAIAAASFAASAQVRNPDNDWATFLTYKATAAPLAAKAEGALPRAGDVSPDGYYVYSGSDRGWVHRAHSYVVAAGKLEHAATCLAYNELEPAARGIPGGTDFGDRNT